MTSPGIIFTPLARDELSGSRGEGYRRMIDRRMIDRRMIEVSAAGRGGTPHEVGIVGAILMGPGLPLVTGSDSLMDGGVTAA